MRPRKLLKPDVLRTPAHQEPMSNISNTCNPDPRFAAACQGSTIADVFLRIFQRRMPTAVAIELIEIHPRQDGT